MKGVSKHCPVCNIDFFSSDNRKKYCSKSCAAKHNNTVFVKRIRTARGYFCEHCGGEISGSGKKFCSSQCSADHRYTEKIAMWVSGDYDASRQSGEISSWARNYLLKQSNHACSKCGWSVANPTTGKVILTLEHKDGNWQNNRFDNLEVLCYNCHTLTKTFGSLNAKNELVSVSRRQANRVGT